MHGIVKAVPHLWLDNLIELAPQRHFVHPRQHCMVLGRRRGDFARVELVVRVEYRFDLLYQGVNRPKKLRRIFRAQTLAMLAPQHTAVFVYQGRHLIGNRFNFGGVLRVFHVKRRAHV